MTSLDHKHLIVRCMPTGLLDSEARVSYSFTVYSQETGGNKHILEPRS